MTVKVPGREAYTVLLWFQHKDWENNSSIQHIAKVWATSPKQAVFFAKYEMQKDTRGIEDHNRDEIEVMAVYEGHLEMLYNE